MPVWYERRIIPGEQYEEAFWHLITKKNHYDDDRLFDSKRAERLPWCKPVLENSNDDSVLFWLQYDRKKPVFYVWLENYDYVIILAKRITKGKEVLFLKTAYYVGSSTRRKLKRRYDNRVE